MTARQSEATSTARDGAFGAHEEGAAAGDCVARALIGVPASRLFDKGLAAGQPLVSAEVAVAFHTGDHMARGARL